MIGVFGGTFNPVHWGHLRTALEIKNSLKLDKMLLIPCRIPPHRDKPSVSPELRLAMLRSAITECEGLEIDERELNRNGLSYTVDTLTSLRQEFPDTPLGLCMGVDAFIHLDSWHNWRQLFDLAHIIIMHRPGWSHDRLTSDVKDELRRVISPRFASDREQLNQIPSGLVLPLKVTNIDISSSEIRQRIANGESITNLVPKGVLQIIQQEKMYQDAIV